jgi:23S rRNA pseudouridine2605 synthase
MNDATISTSSPWRPPCAGPDTFIHLDKRCDAGHRFGVTKMNAHDAIDERNDNGERIAKAIARAGLASRREAEDWIAAGRVAVNGAVISSPALNVTPRDRISVDGEPLPARERTRLFLYHKPRGLMTTRADPQGRPTVFQNLPAHLPRLVSVGRLDFNTEGLLLLTNDGALARLLELPQTGWLRRYRVRAHGSVTQASLDALRAGITVDDIRYGPIEAALERVQGTNLWLTFAIREGKHREVRHVLGDLGLVVTRLIRVSFGPFQLGELAAGAVEEVRTRVLREQLGARLVARSGADFSTPPAPPPPPEKPPRPEKKERAHASDSPKGARDRSTSHSWRADDRPGKRFLPGKKEHAPTSNSPKGTRHRSTSHSWRASEEDRPGKKLRPGKKERAPASNSPKGTRHRSGSHSWRASEEDRPGKKLRRNFRGSRRDDGKPREAPTAEPRTALLTDRKGRRVLVERFGQTHSDPEPAVRKTRHQRRRSPGPRRQRPRDR